jgi:adenylate cyclase
VDRSCRVALWVSIPTCRSPAPLGWTYFWMGQPDAAIAEFEKAVALNSNFVDYRSAVVLVFAGQPERALHVLQAHIRLDPFHPAQLHAIRGVALYMLERYVEAVASLHECMERGKHLPGQCFWPPL